MASQGDTSAAGTAAPSPRAQYMRDYRSREGSTDKDKNRWLRKTREEALATLVHRHESEFEEILTKVRKRRAKERPE